ncbi:Transcription factor jumonji JmjC domain protein [Methylocella tundrae]|uniref:Transcription factor jumonji JmjC domain protein n=1 Tax=Methylocella tundrae TaxID=227605 RepID=A0A8B6M6L5_METTU|nr:cupin-like domain-containing protein [Methylocella tundrae]VTZ26583.1 Transcription factor jumonji JmjC domain protein [Methylocella tundrae]VTZ49960.1 Transcription factor jumonji JmjC domain protein [Methylocella tundrae]
MSTFPILETFSNAKSTLASNASVFAEWLPEHIEKFARKPFLISHVLAQNALFQLPRLERLAKAIHAARIEGRAADAQLKLRRDKPNLDALQAMSCWGAKSPIVLSKERWERELSGLFNELDDGRSTISMMLSFANQVDPEFDALMGQIIGEIAAATGLCASDVAFKGMTVIVSAPRAVTPYHNDREQNVLFQIRGVKDVYLYDQNDPFILSQSVIEAFQIGNDGATRYRAELAGREAVYRLEPGLAVHHPALAPHWVKNGDGVSVSLAVYFTTRSMDDLARIHQANSILRQLGLRPPAPDLSRGSDRLKAAFLRSLSGKRDCDRALFRGLHRLKSPARQLRGAWTLLHPQRPSAA